MWEILIIQDLIMMVGNFLFTIWESLVWQDLVLMVGGFLFTIALIPILRSKKEKPPKSSCLMTGTLLLIFSITYATLGLGLGFISTLSTSIMWFAILAQKILYDKKNNSTRPAS